MDERINKTNKLAYEIVKESDKTSVSAVASNDGLYALELACKLLDNGGDCPASLFDKGPWDEGCAKACDKYTDKVWKCWMQHCIKMSR